MTDTISNPPKLMFSRNFTQLSGGHIKVFDYICHTMETNIFQPVLFVPDIEQIANLHEYVTSKLEIVHQPIEAQAYFVAGNDWSLLDHAGVDVNMRPVINLIQGIRHTYPGTPLYGFLERPAIRICVSMPVADALRDLPNVNGPVFAIPNGSDVLSVARSTSLRQDPLRVLIAGLKAPDLARRIAERMSGTRVEVDLLLERTPRQAYLEYIRSADIAVLLPLPDEGFFLPALEAMAIGTPCVTLDCVGNRDFCLDRINCLLSARTPEAVLAAVHALQVNPDLRRRIRAGGYRMAERHSLAAERAAFLSILRTIA